MSFFDDICREVAYKVIRKNTSELSKSFDNLVVAEAYESSMNVLLFGFLHYLSIGKNMPCLLSPCLYKLIRKNRKKCFLKAHKSKLRKLNKKVGRK